MVRRLVEDEQVDLLVHQHAQPQPALLAAGEGADRLEHVLALKQIRAQPVARGLHGAVLLIEHRVEERPLGVGKVDDLRQVGPLDRGAEFDAARARLLAEENFEEGGLAGAVVAEQGNALAARDLQLDVRKQRPSVIRLAEPLDGQNLVAEEVPLGEFCPHGLVLCGPVGLFDALHPVLDGHGAAVERAVVDAPALHALEREAQLGELGLLLFVLLELQLKARLLFLHVERVVAGIELRLAVVQLHDARDDAVEEIAVVGDGQDGPLKFFNIALEPFHRVHIEVVRRLVEQQDIGLLEQQPREVHARFLAAGEAVEVLLPLRGGDAEAVADLVGLHVRLVAAAGLKARGKRVVLGERGLVRMRRHLLFQLAHFVLDVRQLPEGRAQHVLDGVARGVVRDLGDEADLAAGREAHLAGIVVQLAGQDLEQRRLARAVASEQTDPFALLHVKADAVEQIRIRVKALDEVFYGNIDHGDSSLCFSLEGCPV
jgi:RNase P/RNase MRP subunit p29